MNSFVNLFRRWHYIAVVISRNYKFWAQVSMQLYSKKEKENLQTIVNIMIDYNLNYIQERNQLGAYDYNLDPWVAMFPSNILFWIVALASQHKFFFQLSVELLVYFVTSSNPLLRYQFYTRAIHLSFTSFAYV